MTKRIQQGGLKIASVLYDLIMDEALPGTSVAPAKFWSEFEQILVDLTPKNKALLAKRDALQLNIDDWHQENKQQAFDATQYQDFLKEIGYLVDEGDDFSITTTNVDDEIALIAGPQLVVPVTNARFALNAANARWGSLFDALYGSDIIDDNDGREAGKQYNPVRGAAVVSSAMAFLDQAVPLATGSHSNVVQYSLDASAATKALIATLSDGIEVGLKLPEQFAGYIGNNSELNTILLRNNGLHIEVQIDREHLIGKTTCSGVKDVVIESAISAIHTALGGRLCVVGGGLPIYDGVGEVVGGIGLSSGTPKQDMECASAGIEYFKQHQ